MCVCACCSSLCERVQKPPRGHECIQIHARAPRRYKELHLHGADGNVRQPSHITYAPAWQSRALYAQQLHTSCRTHTRARASDMYLCEFTRAYGSCDVRVLRVRMCVHSPKTFRQKYLRGLRQAHAIPLPPSGSGVHIRSGARAMHAGSHARGRTACICFIHCAAVRLFVQHRSNPIALAGIKTDLQITENRGEMRCAGRAPFSRHPSTRHVGDARKSVYAAACLFVTHFKPSALASVRGAKHLI